MENQNEQQQSPNYNKPSKSPGDAEVLLSLPKAIEQVIYGKKITKLSWEDKTYFIELHEKVLALYKPEDKLYHPWNISQEDLIGEDWVVITE